MTGQLFSCPAVITQKFGSNSKYYRQFGLSGHEGVDFIPSCGDKTVISLTDGIVTNDNDLETNRCYGNHIRIWDKKRNRVFLYAHLEYNKVSVGDFVKKGQVIGKMGNTGKVVAINGDGAHVHVSCYYVTQEGKKVNATNGYLGCVDPCLEEYSD